MELLLDMDKEADRKKSYLVPNKPTADLPGHHQRVCNRYISIRRNELYII